MHRIIIQRHVITPQIHVGIGKRIDCTLHASGANVISRDRCRLPQRHTECDRIRTVFNVPVRYSLRDILGNCTAKWISSVHVTRCKHSVQH